MKNEGFRNGMIELLFGAGLLIVGGFLPIPAMMLVVALVIAGVIYYDNLKKKKRKDFPVTFSKPDEQLRMEIFDYYERLEYEHETRKKSDTWLYYVILPFSVFIDGILFYWAIDNKMFLFLPIVLTFILCIFCIATFAENYYVARKFKLAKAMEVEVAKVEFYDAAYDHHGRTANVTYYVFVRNNVETMKLTVSKHAFQSVVSKQSGEGYLIKNQNGNGVYDVFDFMPVGADVIEI